MESSLSPRDIQARVRAGASVADVAAESGLPESQVEPFAAPVLAERSYMIEQAQAHPVRRSGEHRSGRSLAAVVEQRFAASEVADPQAATDQIDWDAWREVDRRWTIALTSDEFVAQEPDLEHRALFTFDPRGRFSVAKNRAAKWLTGELVPDAPASDPDSEPTLDLLREAEHEQDQRGDTTSSTPAPLQQPSGRGSTQPAPRDPEPEPMGGIEALDPDQVADSQLDVLYDMLASFDEDSVNIYADLDLPIIDDPVDEGPVDHSDDGVDVATNPEAPVEDVVVLEDVTVVEQVLIGTDDEEPAAVDPGAPSQGDQAAASAGEPAARSDADGQHQPDAQDEPVEPTQDPLSFTGPIPLEVEASSGEVGPGGAAPSTDAEATTTDTDVASPDEATPSAPADATPSADQAPNDQAPKKAPARKPATRRKAKGRASIPSWDEIMFGVKGDESGQD